MVVRDIPGAAATQAMPPRPHQARQHGSPAAPHALVEQRINGAEFGLDRFGEIVVHCL